MAGVAAGDEATAREHRDALHRAFVERAPGFLALHDQVNASTSLLDSLESFLSTFQRDLKTVSTHISDLQRRSNRIEARLQARAELERPLSELLATITLRPGLVNQIFDTEPDASWPAAIGELEGVLAATTSGLPASFAAAAVNGSGADGPGGAPAATSFADMQAVKEAREAAEGCRVMAATKIRPALLAPLNSIRTSVSTNLQVLQSSVLLAQHYRPLYAFLARHASRVSIDVQRAYVAAARLYFETGFRRYTRALTTIRNRSVANDVNVLLGEEVPAAGFGANAVAFLSRTRTEVKDSDPSTNDPWLQWDAARLSCAKFNGPTVLLAYQANDATMRAAPELLFRSLSLVLFDNACSEYAFIVRFFEQLPPPLAPNPLGSGSAAPSVVSASDAGGGVRSPGLDGASAFGLHRVMTSSSSVPGRRASAPVSHSNGRSRGSISAISSSRPGTGSRAFASATGGHPSPTIDEAPGPEDSASVAGDRNDDDLDEEDEDEDDEDEADDTVGELGSGFNGSLSLASGRRRKKAVLNVTRLTLKEQRAHQGRGAADELWKQVMEPALGHWLSFVKLVLNASATPPPLLSLAAMLRLNAHLLAASLARGSSAVLHPVLLAFRNEAGPLFRKSLGDNVDSVRKVADVAAAAAGVSTSTGESSTAAASSGLFGGLVRVAAIGGGATPEKITDDFVRLVSSRYARAYSSLVFLSEEGDDDTFIFSEMSRLRSELERLIHAQAKRAGKTSSAAQHLALGTFYEAVIKGLENGPAATAHQRIQAELSHWQEMEQSRQRGPNA